MKTIFLRFKVFAISLVLFIFMGSVDASCQTTIFFPVDRLSLGEGLRVLELQGGRTVAANLSLLDLGQEIFLSRTSGSLDDMTAVVMDSAGLSYRLTDTHILILPPKAPDPEPESYVSVFDTPGVPDYKRISEEQVFFNGTYDVMSVSLRSKDKFSVSYPIESVSYHLPVRSVTPSWLAVKVNFLYGATLTPNAGVELGIGKKSTIDISGGYNFYKPDSGKQWRHWVVQPEYRWWFCERFNGAFIGGHLLGGQFNFSKIDFPFNVFSDLKDYRYEGDFYGIGAVFGYQWILGKRWNLEMAVGAGYVRVLYDKYGCDTCGPALESDNKNYFGPTKASISLLFFL